MSNTYEISEINSLFEKIQKLNVSKNTATNESNENQLINYYFLLFINNLCLKESNLNKIFEIKKENIELHLNLIQLLKDDETEYSKFTKDEIFINSLQIKENIIKLIILNKFFYNQFIIDLFNSRNEEEEGNEQFSSIIEGYFKLIYDLINNNVNIEEESYLTNDELRYLLEENKKIFKDLIIKEMKLLIEKSNDIFDDKDMRELEKLNNLVVVNLESIYEMVKYLNATGDVELLVDIIEFFRVVEKNVSKVRLKDLEGDKETPKVEELSLENDSNKDINKDTNKGLKNKNKKKLRNVRGAEQLQHRPQRAVHQGEGRAVPEVPAAQQRKEPGVCPRAGAAAGGHAAGGRGGAGQARIRRGHRGRQGEAGPDEVMQAGGGVAHCDLKVDTAKA
ncbi:hypothetical protein B5S33_g1049 [[Candida] boidinii]|nr:hypothetical protein B5S33_g1049 [[Candida] boidinii]